MLFEIVYDEATQSYKRIFYIGGDAYNAPAVSIQNDDSNPNIYYICRDYLGSITLITNANGNSVQELSYDAWGNLRDPVNHAVYTSGQAPELLLGRGYTGHEHLLLFGLINMNARMYDPVVGRFLSPDPYVQLPDNLQSFNRYTYGMNNPLCYVDQSGEFWWYALATVVGGAINVASNWQNIDNFWQGLGYFGVGAVATAAGMFTGGAVCGVLGSVSGFAGGTIVGMASGALSGFILGGGNAIVGGASLNDALQSAIMGSAYGSLSGGVFGGLTGGISSWSQGKNFWNGGDIAPGRNAFSVKNTPIGKLERHDPNAFLPSEQPDISLLDTPNSSSSELQNFDSSTSEVSNSMSSTSDVTRFITTPDGITHDLQPTLDRINAGRKFTFRNDGSIFQNRDGMLPISKEIYHEYVHPTPGLIGRPGPMRIITGQNGSIWFTPDHYVTIIRIKF